MKCFASFSNSFHIQPQRLNRMVHFYFYTVVPWQWMQQLGGEVNLECWQKKDSDLRALSRLWRESGCGKGSRHWGALFHTPAHRAMLIDVQRLGVLSVAGTGWLPPSSSQKVEQRESENVSLLNPSCEAAHSTSLKNVKQQQAANVVWLLPPLPKSDSIWQKWGCQVLQLG